MQRDDWKTLQDILHSVALYIARETGVLKGDYSDRQIGVMGTYKTDVLDTARRYKSGEIGREEAKKRIHEASERALIASAVEGAYDFVASKVVGFVMTRGPMLAHVVQTAVAIFRKPAVETVTSVVTKAVDKAKGWLKSLARIFG